MRVAQTLMIVEDNRQEPVQKDDSTTDEFETNREQEYPDQYNDDGEQVKNLAEEAEEHNAFECDNAIPQRHSGGEQELNVAEDSGVEPGTSSSVSQVERR